MDNQPHEPTISDPTYQDKDINLPVVLGVVVITLIVTAGTFVGMKSLFDSYDVRFQAEQAKTASPVLGQRELPKAPLLQVNEPADLAVHLAEEAAKLHGYHWVDSSSGVVQIPIERAMALALERGFPAGSREAQPAVEEPAAESGAGEPVSEGHTP